MQLYQPLSGYCFNSDSLFLYDFISSFNPKGAVLEVGSGCGVIGLLTARDHNIALSQIEKQESFFKFSIKNAQTNQLKSEIFHQDFLNVTTEKKYDYILSNPPFYHGGVVKSEDKMRHTARYNEHLPIEAFFKKVSKLLTPHGHFIFCYDPSQLQTLLSQLDLVKMRATDMRIVYPKAGKPASLVMIHARKSSKSMLKIHPPLMAFEGTQHSKEAQRIYKLCKTHSIKCEI